MNTVHYVYLFGQVWLISMTAFLKIVHLFFDWSIFGLFKHLRPQGLKSWIAGHSDIHWINHYLVDNAFSFRFQTSK